MLNYQLQSLVSKLTTLSGEEFFDSLVLELQTILNAKHLFLANLTSISNSVTTLAYANSGCLNKNFYFDLRNTPPLHSPIFTLDVAETKFKQFLPFSFSDYRCIAAQILGSHHRRQGFIAAFYDSPLEPAFARQVESVLQLFSALSARHIEHRIDAPPQDPLTALEKKLHKHTLDPLTGLTDRNSLLTQIELKRQEAMNHGHTLALLTVCLDNFRYINQSFGHQIGDQLLCQCARRLEGRKPADYILARIAGDEFALLLPNSNRQKCANIASSLVTQLQQPFYLGTHAIKLSASIGAAVFPDDAKTSLQLLTRSDQAATHIKATGKNGYAFYTSQLSQQNNHKLHIKHALSLALKNRELEVFYQPIINLHTKSLEKCEALVRWTHQGENIAPLDFIPIAEEFGLAQELGRFVWETACNQVDIFKKNGIADINISVNRSMAEFPHNTSHNQDWGNTLISKNIDHSQISFEITETILAPENKKFSEYLSQLKRSGCSISLDDFGTGYSSLSYLRDFPIDYLKIDRSFIIGIDVDDDALALVTSIIDMAKALNIKTIAEGVETKAQLTILDGLNCDYIQGFFFSKPIRGDDFIKYSNSFCYETCLQAS